MALRHLQLLRNSSINQLRDLAKDAASGQSGQLKDGDVIVARYLIKEGQGSGSTNVAIAVGHKVGGTDGYILWNDNQELKELISASTASTENLEKAVGVAHNASAITFNDGSHYVGTTNSASGAIQSLDTNLYATSGKVDEVRAAIGSSASTLDVAGNYVVATDTVKQAVTSLDSNLFTVSGKTDSGITAFNDYTTSVVGRASGTTGLGATGSNITSADTVQSAVQKLDAAIESGDTATDNLRKAVGAASGSSVMAYPNTNYIVSDTTVSGALVTLDAKLYTVSGDLDTQEAEYSAYTKNVIGAESGSTKFVTSGEVASASTTVKTAVEALDAAIVELSGASTTDVENLRKAVGVASGASAVTFGNTNYIGTIGSVSGALVTLDTNLLSANTKADNLDTIVGVASGDTQLNASGKYVSGSTVKVALQNLNDAIVNGETDDANLRAVVGVESGATTLTIPNPNYVGATPQVSGAIKTLDTVEKATRDTIGGMNADGTSGMTITGTNYINNDPTVLSALTDLDSVEKATRDAVGLVGTASTISLEGDYISGQTNVKGGLEVLDDKLYELSGKATSNTILAQNPISSQTITNSGTTVGLKLDASITDSSVTSTSETNMHKNILAVSENGLYALADLHYTAVTNTLEFVNTNGKRTIQLTGVKVFDKVEYISSAETIELTYTDLSGGTGVVDIPVSGIIEEYQFENSDEQGATPASSTQHNVSLYADRDVSGATEVYGELSVFDCGTY